MHGLQEGKPSLAFIEALGCLPFDIYQSTASSEFAWKSSTNMCGGEVVIWVCIFAIYQSQNLKIEVAVPF